MIGADLNLRTAESIPVLTRQADLALATLLGQRFGDGLVYLQNQADSTTLERARRLGLVNADGYLTSTGRKFWNRRDGRI